MSLTEEQKKISRSRFYEANEKAKPVLKEGDRLRVRKCPGTKRTITFSHWDGVWMVSKSGIDDYAACTIDMVNGEKKSFCSQEEII